ncbi:peptidoglycan-binding protein [Actinotalea ferrariae]|uniref:peptidoglycan-binding domain-containing protein n=1 Tax=Actinotalea ferrariae TaxID=1386098 RepID=UPI001C8B782C|nr:peptidoglycan-binding protein [Actinotalea ferrariae]MBX9245268.1 peptidoglycan-binding protein [Actinotalea ferrariae]
MSARTSIARSGRIVAAGVVVTALGAAPALALPGEPPAFTLDGPSGTIDTDSVQLTIADATGGAEAPVSAMVSVNGDDRPWGDVNQPFHLDGLPDDDYVVVVTVRDAEDETASQSVSFTVDTAVDVVAPSVANGAVTLTRGALSFDLDTLVTPGTGEVSVDLLEFGPDELGASYDWETHVVTFSPWEPGTYTLDFQATGRTEGNWDEIDETSGVGTLTVAVVAPVVSFAAKPEASTTSTSAHFEIAADTSDVEVSYVLDLPPGQQHASPVHVSGTTIDLAGLAAGRHTIRVVVDNGVVWSALDYEWVVVGTGAPVTPAVPVAPAPAPAPAAQPVLASTAIPASVVARGIRAGASGESVAIIQRVVGATPDGRFGKQTRAAVVAFQRAHGLVPDGIVGPLTWAAIVSAANGGSPVAASSSAIPAAQVARGIRQGARGTSVAVIQRVVGADVDGRFGPRTKAAVRSWQAAHGLVADGIVGPLTWAAMTAR